MSGNIIDLCPVGALNNKPYRFSARAWEMIAKPIIGAHDCAGSNLYAHVLRGKLRRVVPRDNEEINEAWIADRDRFSCHGIYVEDRLLAPRIKGDDGEWRDATWQVALEAAAEMLRAVTQGGGDALGTLASPSSTLEELYLLSRITRHLGSENVDTRLRRRDFRDQDADPAAPWLGSNIADLETRQGILVVGSNVRMEVPIVAHWLRKAARKGASVAFVNPEAYEYHFKAAQVFAPLDDFVAQLAAVAVAAAKAAGVALPQTIADAAGNAAAGAAHEAAAAAIVRKPGLILLGHIAQRHPRFADIRAVAAAIAAATGAELGYLAEGANGYGAAVAGALPHRGAGGPSRSRKGRDAQRMLAEPRTAYILFGIEPSLDLANGRRALDVLKSAKVVCFTPFVSDELLECADILLPTATFAETAGTFVNAEGRWQSFDAAAVPEGDARPGWRVLRVLGNELGLPECDYRQPGDVSAALERELGGRAAPGSEHNVYRGSFAPSAERAVIDAAARAEIDVGIYAIDGVVRRSEALQETSLAKRERAV
jgi:NADH-quinone oxidoreductase subunit G